MARKANVRTPNSQKSAHRSGGKSGTQTTYIVTAVVAALAIGIGLYLAFGRGGGGKEIQTPSGLKYVDEVVGTGASPTKGKQVTVNYLGTLEDGTKFDSSYDRSQPFSFAIGTGQVVKGWDEGIMSMKVGGKRKLIIPPDLGYGVAGRPPQIPGNSTLIFEVELLGVQ